MDDNDKPWSSDRIEHCLVFGRLRDAIGDSVELVCMPVVFKLKLVQVEK